MENRKVWLLSAGHLFTDINQGALPAILPFLIKEINLNYAAAAGLVLAASVVSSVIQPLFGHFADRISKPWLMPFGILLAGAGMAATGFLPTYPYLLAAVTIAGIGVAAFHPEAARMANRVSGEKQGTGLSIFSVGGNAGFALGPLVTTGALVFFGLKGTLFLIGPAVIMATILVLQAKNLYAFSPPAKAEGGAGSGAAQDDEWVPFSRMTVVVFCRSIIFYGFNTFLPLYWINVLHQPKAAGGLMLTVLLSAGATGTFLGGWFADRFGYRTVIRIGLTVLLPILLVFTAISNVGVATLLLIPMGLFMFSPMSPLLVLGQKYLPNRIGFASGVTLGLAVGIGGVSTPVLGWFADNHGLAAAMHLVAYVPVLAILLAFTLPKPRSGLAQRGKGSPVPSAPSD